MVAYVIVHILPTNFDKNRIESLRYRKKRGNC